MGLQPSFAALTEDIKTQATAKITAAAETAGLSNQAVNIRVGDPRDEIIAAANEMQANLIVMGSNTHSAVNRLLLGSTARGVLNHTPAMSWSVVSDNPQQRTITAPKRTWAKYLVS